MSISPKFAASSFYSVLGTGSNNVAQFLVFAVLARLLNPEAIGIVAFALVFVELGKVIVYGGLPEAVIQRKEWEHEFASTCFSANLIGAIVFVAVMAGIFAPLISQQFARGSGEILTALSCILIIDAARAIHEAKLKREFGYKLLAIRGATATLVSGAIGIAMAYYGFEVWALVAQRLVSSLMLTLLTWRAARWRPTAMLSVPMLRSVSGFALHVTPARLLAVFGTKLPEFIIGLFLGPAAVGYYRIGARGIEAISQFTVNPVREAALSAFSRLPNAAAIGAAYLRVTRLAAFVACPVYLGSAAIAPDLIHLVFGPQWVQSGPIMAAIAIAIGGLVFAFFLQTAMTAAGRTGVVLGTSAGGFVAILGVSLAAVPFGITAVAIANSARAYLSMPFWLAAIRRTLNLGWKHVVMCVLPSFVAAAIMAACVHVLAVQLGDQVQTLVRVVLCVALGGVLYPALLMIFARGYFRIIRTEIQTLLPARLRNRFWR